MSFKKSLARIEEILELMEDVEGAAWLRLSRELEGILNDSAEEIVKLGKVASSLRSSLALREMGVEIPWTEVHLRDEENAIHSAKAYDKLMGEEV